MPGVYYLFLFSMYPLPSATSFSLSLYASLSLYTKALLLPLTPLLCLASFLCCSRPRAAFLLHYCALFTRHTALFASFPQGTFPSLSACLVLSCL
jgi:hypothetical protein